MSDGSHKTKRATKVARSESIATEVALWGDSALVRHDLAERPVAGLGDPSTGPHGEHEGEQGGGGDLHGALFTVQRE